MGLDLIGRMAEQGVIANIQPSFLGTDSRWVQDRIERDVQEASYCWKVREG
jgi:predicted amidohydrolase YtcJ